MNRLNSEVEVRFRRACHEPQQWQSAAGYDLNYRHQNPEQEPFVQPTLERCQVCRIASDQEQRSHLVFFFGSQRSVNSKECGSGNVGHKNCADKSENLGVTCDEKLAQAQVVKSQHCQPDKAEQSNRMEQRALLEIPGGSGACTAALNGNNSAPLRGLNFAQGLARFTGRLNTSKHIR